MNSKIKVLREDMKFRKLDGMIITNTLNISYILGVKAEGTFLITDKENVFITDARYIEEVNNIVTIDDEIIIMDAISVSESDYLSFFATCNRVGIEENNISYAKYQKFIRLFRLKEAVETENIIEKQRMIKSDEEISKIRKACEITDNCFSHLLNYIKIGMTEKQIALEIEKCFFENGADSLAFDTIVASGENSSKPHAMPTDRKIKSGDAIVIDFGAKYKGYSSDMTRTIFAGSIDDEIKELYNFVLACQKRVSNKIKAGADGQEISEGLEKEFNARNYSLIHALGHGVGIDVHEMPYLSYRACYILKESMIVTNEPGIYIPGKLGIRIEDTILVNKLQSEELTKSNKNLIII